MKRFGLFAVLTALGGMAVWAMAGSPEGPGEQGRGGAGSTPAALVAPNEDLVVHEWGTFTTFSGSDGVHLEFRPLANGHHDLPDFVQDRAVGHPSAIFSKSRLRAKVRMETPITYFYTDRERTVRASVEFPKGLLTEFYPPVQSFAPPFDVEAAVGPGEKIGQSRLDWGQIRLVPAKAFRPAVANEAEAEWLQQRILDSVCLPGNGHYAAARGTDSAFVLTERPPQPFLPGGRYLEKFLFYRGVGKFDLPVQVEAGEDGAIRVRNRGSEPLQSLFLVEVDGGVPRLSTLDTVEGGGTAVLPPAQTFADPQTLQQAMVGALIREGLYEKEARAMVATWDDSWFCEEGTRVFYMVPRPVTDSLLPLKIDPQPKETVRVLVARLEVMRSADERRLMEVVKQSAAAREAAQPKGPGRKAPPVVVPEEIARLGRLAEPALVRVESISRDPAVRAEAALLLGELRRENAL